MQAPNKLALVLLTIFSSIFLIISIVIFWAHLFLPDPRYTVQSYTQVVTSELIWGLQNFIIEAVILFLPIHIIFLFLDSFRKKQMKRRQLKVAVSVLVISFILTTNEILKDIKTWEPLRKAVNSAEQKQYQLGRTSFIPKKEYSIKFTKQAQNLSFIKAEIIPVLERYGYKADNFGGSIGEQLYTQSAPSTLGKYYESAIQVQNINEIPFDNALQDKNNFIINFVRKDPYGYVNMNISYESGKVSGRLVTN